MATLFKFIFVLILCIKSVHRVTSLPGSQKLWRSWPNPADPILPSNEINVTGVTGTHVSLPCRVKNLEDKTISWIRAKDLTVLAVDTTTYTGDTRFSVKHDEDSEDWWLHLEDVSQSDEGLYDCQINTYPKVSTKIYLKVVTKQGVPSVLDVPVADTEVTSSEGGTWKELSGDLVQSKNAKIYWVTLKIKGSQWVTVQLGKSLQLICEATRKGGPLIQKLIVSKNIEEQLIRWTLDDVPVEILFPEWKVNVHETWTSSGIDSELRLNSVTPADAGEIACIAPHALPASVTFHVEEIKSPKQHYPGLSNSKAREEPHHVPYPMTSVVSRASAKQSNSKFAVISTAILIILTVTNMAVCYHYLRTL